MFAQPHLAEEVLGPGLQGFYGLQGPRACPLHRILATNARCPFSQGSNRLASLRTFATSQSSISNVVCPPSDRRDVWKRPDCRQAGWFDARMLTGVSRYCRTDRREA